MSITTFKLLVLPKQQSKTQICSVYIIEDKYKEQILTTEMLEVKDAWGFFQND